MSSICASYTKKNIFDFKDQFLLAKFLHKANFNSARFWHRWLSLTILLSKVQTQTHVFIFSSSLLTIDKLLRVTDWVAFPPITQLLQHPGILLQHPKSYHLQLHSEINDNNQHFTVSYKIIVSNFGSPNNISPSFRRVHNNIRKGQLVVSFLYI